ncbi:hypothetical protein [Mesorhizobium sp. M0204]|uniref:hypothetical protein n=1 Tax=unclassified Mesorhizobium TaxID=325217 RepID=UPI0033360EE1
MFDLCSGDYPGFYASRFGAASFVQRAKPLNRIAVDGSRGELRVVDRSIEQGVVSAVSTPSSVAQSVGERVLSRSIAAVFAANYYMAAADAIRARNISGVEGSSISFPMSWRAAMICT